MLKTWKYCDYNRKDQEMCRYVLFRILQNLISDQNIYDIRNQRTKLRLMTWFCWKKQIFIKIHLWGTTGEILLQNDWGAVGVKYW
jgi:hypothetical protein